jgi:hypothetical protein
VLNAVLVAPIEEALELLLSGLVCTGLEVIRFSILRRLVDALHGVEKAQKRELNLPVHL